jgi:outer membrane protein assembly factor BamB
MERLSVKRQLRIYLLTAGLIVLLTSISFYFENRLGAYADSPEDPDNWPMFRHDLQHTGYSSSTAPDKAEVKWFYNTTMEVDSSPAVANGRLIVGVSNGQILALNSTTGQKLWSYDTGAGSNSIWGSPAIDSDKVYLGTRDHNLYCLNETTGAFIWKYSTGDEIDSSPLINNGKVFFGSHDGKLYCLNADNGALIWNFTTNGGFYSSPALWNDVVFIGAISTSGFVSMFYAINASTGGEIWSYPTMEVGIDTSPAVDNGKIFFASSMGKVYCLNATTGSLVWSTPGALSFVRSSPAVANDRVFIGDDYSTFYCFNASTGESIWNFTAISGVWSSPAVADGKVFFGTEHPGLLYCLNERTGEQIWSYQAIERVASSPAIFNGTVFVGCGSAGLGVGGVYAFGEKYSLPTRLSLSLDSQTSLVGFKVDLTGALTGNGTAMAGASILLSYSVTSGQTWNDITSIQTSNDGSYSAVWIPSATGTFLVRAFWDAYYPFDDATSYEMLSVTTYDDEYVFAVSSNSTLSALVFDSESSELRFTVTGETGTTGFTQVSIAKSLVENITDLKVYLDGGSLDYTVTSTDSSWVIYFVYTHSTHSVTIDLGASQDVSPSPSPSPSPTPSPNPSPTPSPTPTPTQSPDETPSPTTTPSPEPQPEPFPTTWVIVTVVALTVLVVSILVYFKKFGKK